MRVRLAILPGLAAAALACASPAVAAGSTTSATSSSGGVAVGVPAASPSTPSQPTVVGYRARIIHGVAYAPSYAPIQVRRAIWAGDKIRHKPYIYGGGHGVWNDSGYDCSGTVSYLLHAAGLLKASMASGEMMSWGRRGAGQWITVYTNPGHAFIEIAGIRMDTSREGDPHPAPGTGPRWRPLLRNTGGYVARHPAGF